MVGDDHGAKSYIENQAELFEEWMLFCHRCCTSRIAWRGECSRLGLLGEFVAERIVPVAS